MTVSGAGAVIITPRLFILHDKYAKAFLFSYISPVATYPGSQRFSKRRAMKCDKRSAKR